MCGIIPALKILFCNVSIYVDGKISGEVASEI